MSAPSGYTALDFVGFTDKGTYSPIVKYMRNDLVHYGGNIMRCKVDDTLNVTPVEGANWELWIGASANLAERTIAPLENNPADVAFGVGRQIIYDDWLWEVIAPIAVGDALIDYAVDPTNANIKKSAPVETQLLAVKAEADATDNMIAPTEASASSSSAAYSVGDQLILNNILYDVIAAIQIGDALTTGTGGNIAAADTLTDQLNAKANSSDLAAVATSGAYSDLSGTPTLATVATSGSYNDLSNKPTLGTAAAKNSTNAVTQSSTDLVESGAVYSEVDSVKQALTNVAIPVYTPKSLNMEGEEVADIIDALPANAQLIFPTDTYTVTKEIVIDKKCIIDFNNSVLNYDKDNFVLNPVSGQGSRGWGMVIEDSAIIKNVTIDCGNANNYSNFYTTGNVDLNSNLWGIIVRSSNVKLENIHVQNTAINGITIYKGGINDIEISHCSVVNSCGGILVETPANEVAPISAVDIHDCKLSCVACYTNGGTSSVIRSSYLERAAGTDSYNSDGAPLTQAGINDAEVPEGARSEFDNCYIIDNHSSKLLIRIYGKNTISNLKNTGEGLFTNCTFHGNTNYGVLNNGRATFINCFFYDTCLMVANDRNTDTVAIGCKINPHVDQSSFGTYASAPSTSNFITSISIENCIVAEDSTNRLGLPAAANSARGEVLRLKAFNNKFNLPNDQSYLKNSILIGNINITDGSNLLSTSPTAAQASANNLIVDNHPITYT